MKISLIHPKSPNIAKSTLIWPPLGLCRIASYLELRGHLVNIIEDGLHHFDIDSFQFSEVDIVGIGAMTVQAKRAWQWIEKVKELYPTPKIVVGGPHFCTHKDGGMLDAVVIGDGEQAMLEVIAGKRGIIYGSPVGYVPISFEKIEYSKYGDHLVDGRRAISILTSRGCPNACKFCGSPLMFGSRVLWYPISYVVSNMERLSKRHNIRNFRIMDDNFLCNDLRVKDFCKRIGYQKYSMSCLANVNTITETNSKLLKDAGFEWVAIGAESSDQAILNLANKYIKPQRVKTTAKILTDSGIKVEVLFMIGLPGETKETLEATIEFAVSLKADRIHSQYFTPFPGSRFYEEIESGMHGKILTYDWDKYDHRHPVFVPFTISYEDLVEGGQKFFKACGRL